MKCVHVLWMAALFATWGCDGWQPESPVGGIQQSLVEGEAVAEGAVEDSATLIQETRSDLLLVTEFRRRLNQVLEENIDDCHVAVERIGEILDQDGAVFGRAMVGTKERIMRMSGAEREQIAPHLQGEYQAVYVEGALLSRQAVEQWDKECLNVLKQSFMELQMNALAGR